MANPKAIEQLAKSLASLSSVDMDSVLRPGAGTMSLAPDMNGMAGEITLIENLARKYATLVDTETVGKIIATVDNITTTLESQSGLNDIQYANNSASFLNKIRGHIDYATTWKPTVVSEAILHRGLLEIEDFKDELARAQSSVEVEVKKLVDDSRAKAEELIQEATETKNAAQDTAMAVSVHEAQKQFNEAAAAASTRVKLWAFISAAVSAGLLAACIVLFRDISEIPRDVSWEASLPQALIRIFFLSVLAGIVTFTFKMLRAYLHIADKNRHRVRVANSIESFVHSAKTPSQRDLILARLTESIVNYGDSGLIHHEREDRSVTMSGDLMGRIISAISGKGN